MPGLYGLAVMGQNFALNMASHGFSVAVANRSPDKVNLKLATLTERSFNIVLGGHYCRASES